jgi:hypothetical protein
MFFQTLVLVVSVKGQTPRQGTEFVDKSVVTRLLVGRIRCDFQNKLLTL